MNDSIRLGTLRGLRIGANWSVLFIAWLLAWSLASRVFPGAAPGLGAAAYWTAGVVVALAFLASILAHELAHAFFARRAGVKVEGITLWALGGVARLEGEAPTPGHEFRIAASGPAVSGLLGLVFGAGAFALGALGAPALVAQAAAWLGGVNIALALFNLLPGAPLDGGRIVRAVAWGLGRDRLRASLLAVRLGRIVGFGLVGFGLFELVVGSDLGGLWTVVIGLFMTGSAAAEGAQEVARATLGGVPVREAMTPDPVRAPAGITVDLFAEAILAAEGQSAALVVDPGDRAIGIAGVAEVAALKPAERRQARVRDIAVPIHDLPVVAPDDDLLTALERIGSSDPAPYLVVRDRDAVLVGLVTPTDLARTIQRRAPGAGLPAGKPSGAGAPS